MVSAEECSHLHCMMCGQPFNWNFKDRIKMKVDRPFRCHLCKLRLFATQQDLDIHIKCHSVDNSNTYKCPACMLEIPRWSTMVSHLIKHPEYKEKMCNSLLVRNVIGSFSCHNCCKVFERKVSLHCHIRNVHRKLDHKCHVCNCTLKGVDAKTLARHTDRCLGITMSCSVCDYTTMVSANLRRHVRMHVTGGYRCSMCDKAFPTRQQCKVHELVHLGAERPKYACEYCGHLFVSEDAVKKHVTRVHEQVSRRFECAKCEYSAHVEADLRKHERFVHAKKHLCSNCVFSSNTLTSLERHQATMHSGDGQQGAASISTVSQRRMHNCPICAKQFNKKAHLMRHLVSHASGSRPYSCQECGETFSSHTSYYRHRRKTGHDRNRDGVASVPRLCVAGQPTTEAPEMCTEDSDSHNTTQTDTCCDRPSSQLAVISDNQSVID